MTPSIPSQRLQKGPQLVKRGHEDEEPLVQYSFFLVNDFLIHTLHKSQCGKVSDNFDQI